MFFSFGTASRSGNITAAVLPLTFWVQGDFTGSPWEGSVSAGTSGTHDFSEGSTPPTVGTGLNGYDAADFDGTNQFLVNSDGSLISTSSYSYFALVYIRSSGTDTATSYANDAILGDLYVSGITVRHNGGSPLLYLAHYQGSGENYVTTSVSYNTWTLIQARYDGSDIKIRTNNNAWSSPVGATDLYSFGLTGSMYLGRNAWAGIYSDIIIQECGGSNVAFTDAEFDLIFTAVNSRYSFV